MINIRIIFLLLFITLQTIVKSQTISGVVYDEATKQPMPFVTVSIKGTNIGSTTANDGSFKIVVKNFPCTLDIRFVGYYPIELSVDKSSDKLIINMKEEVRELDEIIVTPNYAYDYLLLRKIISNRKNNNPDLIENITYNDYCRTSVFLTGVKTKTIKSLKFLSSINDSFVQETDSTVRIPIMISESLEEITQSDKKEEKTVKILADSVETILPAISQQIESLILNKIITDFNFYDNQIDILGRGLPSPISSFTKLYYNVYLTDSLIKDDIKHYKFTYIPKSHKALALNGYFWAESKSWAITELYAIVPDEANINFVSGMIISANYQSIGKRQWFYNNQLTKLNLSIVSPDSTNKNATTVAIQKLKSYSVKDFDTIALLKRANRSLLSIEREKTPLDSFESKASEGIKKIHSNRYLKFADKLSYFGIYGYYNIGLLDIGPNFLFYHTNAIEGHRFSVPLRTSSRFSKNFMMSGYAGYGTLNEELAYGGSIAYQTKSPKRTLFWINTRYDYFELTYNKFIDFIKENPYQQGSGNFISPFTTYVKNLYMIRSRMINFTFEHDFNKSIGIFARPSYEVYENNINLDLKTPQGDTVSNFSTSTLLLNIRLSHDQSFDEEFFARVYYGNGKPIYNISALIGQYNIGGGKSDSDNTYLNLNASIKHRFNINNIMLVYLLEIGGIIGDVPFPLLNLPKGTMDLGSARYHYNLLFHTSFVSDAYINLHVLVNMGGLLFNRIPLIKKLNLREFVVFKAYYGKLYGNHNKIMTIPDYLRECTEIPYMESSVGIANIFKFFRIEYVFRINDDPIFNDFSARQGIRMRFEVSF